MENKTLDLAFEYELKQEGEEEGLFTGIASPFGGKPDSYGDIIMPGAYTETIQNGGRNGNGIAMLAQHNIQRPIGVWRELAESKKGLKVTGQLAIKSNDGRDTYELLKAGALKGLSIGYEVEEFEEDAKKKIRYLKKINLWEISIVTFPAATRATITTVKSIIENATTRKELEDGLRNEGLSRSAAAYVASLIRHKNFTEAEEDSGMLEILNKMRRINKNLEGFERKRVITYRPWSKAPESEAWNGPAEIRKADVDDLKIMCTWYDAENADVKSAYKLPHHKADGYATVWRGVSAAMGALLGARGGVNIPSADKRGVYNHLAKHYKQFDKEPPDFQ